VALSATQPAAAQNSPPTIVTLAATNITSNVATLQGSAAAGATETDCWFEWGLTTNYGNTTSVLIVPAGSTATVVRNTLATLAINQLYHFRFDGSNAFGVSLGADVSFTTSPWRLTSVAQDGRDNSISVSADGSRIVAAGYDSGRVYSSADFGVTWTSDSAAGVHWQTTASLAGVETSTDSGATWTLQTNGLTFGNALVYIASSADGVRLAMVEGTGANPAPVFVSANGGLNWKRATNAPLQDWYSVASSADGRQLIAGAYNGGVVCVSGDGGEAWTTTRLPANNWNSVAVSADGSRMAAVAYSGSSVAGAGNGGIYTSSDYGITWVANLLPSLSWSCVVMSADGQTIVAAVGHPGSGGVYVAQFMPAPILSLAAVAGVQTVSWLLPSTNFALQCSPDLAAPSWQNVTNEPTLNLTNLHDEVAIPLPLTGNAFYRLKH